jgi:hypothetical protein
MKNIKIFFGRIIIIIDEEFHEVELYNPKKKLKKGFAYIKDDLVYIYYGKMKSDIEELPGIYLVNNEHKIIEPKKSERSKYSIDNIVELDVDKIFKDIENHSDDFISPEDIETINNNVEVFIPTIKEDDDFLKYIVKKIIIDKKINLKNYQDKFTNQYALNNMKSGLSKETKMSVPNFKIWCEILGIKWKMEVEDSGEDKTNPLPEKLIVTSDNF